MKKLLCLILSVIMLLSVFVACGETEKQPGKTESTSASDATSDAAATVAPAPTDPDSIVMVDERKLVPDPYEGQTLDYDGMTITMQIDNAVTNEFFEEEPTTEALSVALHNRTLYLKERMNIDLDYLEMHYLEFTKMQGAISSGDCPYQIMYNMANYIAQIALKGIFYNVQGEYMEDLDLTNPWWSQHYTEQADIDGYVYACTGDGALAYYTSTLLPFYNRNMGKDYNIESPYTLVDSGEWTLDRLAEMVRGIYTDVNSDGLRDKEDMYGFVLNGQESYDAFWAYFDFHFIKRDETGDLTVDPDVDYFQSAMEKLAALSTNTGVLINHSTTEDYKIPKFINDEALFIIAPLSQCDQLRDMTSDYSILPGPKYNEEQEDYYSFNAPYVFTVPITVEDTEPICVLLEEIGWYSYRNVMPTYFDIVLRNKYLRDVESTKALQIALENMIIDTIWIYTEMIANIGHVLLDEVPNGKSDFASYFAANEKRINQGLKHVVSSIYKRCKY